MTEQDNDAAGLVRRLAPDMLARLSALTALFRAGRSGEARAMADGLLAGSGFGFGPGEWTGLGLLLLAAREPDRAVTALSRAAILAPDHAPTHVTLGAALEQTGQAEAAADHYRRAIALDPGHAQAHVNLGNALATLRRPAEAAEAFRRAVALAPDSAPAHNNLGNALNDLGRLDEAVAEYRRAILIDPAYALAHNNLGSALHDLGHDADVVLDCFARAIALDPAYAVAHNNRGIALLAQGRLAEGWREFEWRRQRADLPLMRRFESWPAWRGETLTGRTLLLSAEQGLGDMIQFCRYAPILARQGARVILETYPSLVRLMSTLPGVAGVAAVGAPPPPAHMVLPLMSAPFLLGTTLETIPADGPYLAADPAAAAAWGQRLAALPGRRVGLVWSGNPRPGLPREAAFDRRRSLPLAALAPLFDLPGLSFVSLQAGGAARQMESLPTAPRLFDPMGEVVDFADTAAIVANLDLVISVDTSVAHLAGALGKPVWILSRFAGCWRWLGDRDDSPWYPTARLFRQDTPGTWAPVLARLTQALRDWRDFPLHKPESL